MSVHDKTESKREGMPLGWPGHALMRVVLLNIFLRPVNHSTSSHNNAVVIRATMIRNITLKHGGHVSDNAKIRRVILA